MNLPNKLTIFRIILVPVMVVIPFFHIPGEFFGIPISMWLMNLIFILASITDKLDGTIARARNQVTTFGKFLDPIADKILVLAAMMLLVEMNKLPAWIPIIILFREFVVSRIPPNCSRKRWGSYCRFDMGKIKNRYPNDCHYFSIYGHQLLWSNLPWRTCGISILD